MDTDKYIKMIAEIYRQGFIDGMKASQDFLQMMMDNYMDEEEEDKLS